ncbi:MAG: hypothetical protein LBL92_01535 [Propionibacteriaceae bacterium]|nr:hypothetical protein [Propionibacteriaceae bacterium]
MVFGLDVFTQHFQGFENRYVLIGGTACELVLAEYGQSFRVTKDLDIVLVAETVDAAYVARFLEFVELGGYRHASRSSNSQQYYRFDAPNVSSYPAMLELFSRRPGAFAAVDTHLGRVRVEDAPHSLSAILLDDDYYLLLQQGTTRIQGLPVLDLEHLPVFKMKAWLELTAAKARGEHVNTGDIAKHKNDVFRLTSAIEPDARIRLPDTVGHDVSEFLDGVPLLPNDLSNLGIRGYTPDELLTLIASIYSTSVDKSAIYSG